MYAVVASLKFSQDQFSLKSSRIQPERNPLNIISFRVTVFYPRKSLEQIFLF